VTGYDFERHRLSYLAGTSTDWIALSPQIRGPESAADWPDIMLVWIDPTIQSGRVAHMVRRLVDEPDRLRFVDREGRTRELRPVTLDAWNENLRLRSGGPAFSSLEQLIAFWRNTA
jgi:hypothetical protein